MYNVSILRTSSPLPMILLLTGCAASMPATTVAPGHAKAATPARAAASPAPTIDPALLERCRTTKALSAAPIRVVWRADRFASVFWSVDQWSRWNEEQTSDVYASFFRRELGDSPADRDMLARYRKLRVAYSREREDAPPDPAHPMDMLVPETTPADAFARAFFCTGEARAAATLIGMRPEETAEMSLVFDHFSARLGPIVMAPHVDRGRVQMEEMAARSRMSDFLDRMVDFFGVRARVPGELTVEILWGPPDNHQATTLSDRMIVPISERVAGEPKRLASWVGVTVHEFGHQMLGSVTPEVRHRVSDRIIARTGVLRQRHANLVDEATQAALGNLHFVRTFLPEGLDEQSVYAFEPRLDYPDAIDSLARRAEPLVARALERHETFGGAYLDALLDEQTRLMPPRLGDFARVGFVLAGSKTSRQRFDGLFWGVSRFGYDVSAGDDSFATDSEKNRGASRWIVLTEGERPGLRPLAERARVNGVDELAKDLVRRRAKGCVRASRRPDTNGADGGYDVVVIGRDPSGLRETLIAVQRGLSPAAASPYCLP